MTSELFLTGKTFSERNNPKGIQISEDEDVAKTFLVMDGGWNCGFRNIEASRPESRMPRRRSRGERSPH
jgi:hypothetical protein